MLGPTERLAQADAIAGATGEGKPPLRTGEHVRMCAVLRNQQLDKLLFGGGSGADLVQAIRRQAVPDEWD